MLKIIKKLLSQYAKAMFSKSTPLVITPIIGFIREKNAILHKLKRCL